MFTDVLTLLKLGVCVSSLCSINIKPAIDKFAASTSRYEVNVDCTL